MRCWHKYFTEHTGAAMAVSSVVTRLSPERAVAAYGKKFMKHFYNFRKGEYALKAA
jgi:hypothetical protein